MYIWSLWLSLALICCSVSVRSQSCHRDSDCHDGSVCCRSRTCARGARCPCVNDNDCKFRERCDFFRNVCDERNGPSWYTPKHVFPTYKPHTSDIPTFDNPTFNPDPPASDPEYCVFDNDCSGTKICEDGKCRSSSGRGGLSWSGSKLVGIVLFVIVATIISCLYHACKRARKPPNLPSRNVNINTPPTGVEATGGNDHEMQAGSVDTTSSTVVEIEDDTPLPPGAPPPYSSLQFETRQGSENPSDPPPPSYDEAVRNSSSN